MRIVPPVYFATAIGAQWVLDKGLPVVEFIPEGAAGAGWLFIAGAGAVIVTAAGLFNRMDTPIHPFREARALITAGPFALTRNPIYLAMAFMLAGAAILLRSATPFLLIPVFMIVLQETVIKGEEAMLEEAFGDEYRDYASRVRRWL